MSRVWSDKLPSVLVCLVYRPLKVSFGADPTFITTLRDLCSEYSHKIIMGDFNADLLVNNTDIRYLMDLSKELSL